jgi:ABC-2 type transport system permease protein
MAGLDPPSSNKLSNQFRAVAWLRWRITINQFRKKGGAGEIIGSIVLWLVFASFAVSLMAAAAFTAGISVATNHTNRIDIVLWAAFCISQFLNIQVGQPGTVFDPTQLIRFPLSVRSYIIIRLFFGLLTPANVLIFLLSMSVATGITIAEPRLWFYAFTGMFAFAATNALFSRMIFAWVDRWLSTRRSREVFTALIFLGSLGIQYANVTFNPAYHHHKQSTNATQNIARLRTFYHAAQPYTRPLPPGLLASSMQAAQLHNIAAWAANVLGCIAFAAVFYAIFAWRTTTEFRGESLTDAANAVSTRPRATPLATPAAPALAMASSAPRSAGSHTIAAVFHKEILQVRRNAGLFMGIIAPIFFVFIFAGRIAARGNAPWIFPVALVYVMMGLAPLTFNSFGLEGEGAQLYFMAPIRMRDVLLAKNLISFAIAAVDIVVTIFVIHYVAVLPGPTIIIASMLWIAATLMVATLFGNRRSITTPKKIEPGRVSSKQASQVSALISFGILLASAAVGGSLLTLTIFFGHAWMLPPVFAAFAIAAWYFYNRDLDYMNTFAYEHRENLLEVLGKKAA